MIIITVATNNTGYYESLVKSCKIQAISLITLGMNMKWKGLMMKYDLLKEYLVNINDNEIIMFVDAYDVIILENEKTIVNKFKKFNKKIIFGMHNDLLVRTVSTTCNGYVLNSGCYIGYVKYIKRLLNILTTSILQQKISCDQEVLNRICASRRYNYFFKKYMEADVNQTIFYITDMTYYLDYKYLIYGDIGLIPKGGTLKLKTKNNTPSVLHLAGGIDGKKILKYLNLDTKNTKNIKNTGNGIIFKINQLISILKIDNVLYIIIFFVILLFLIRYVIL